MDNQDTNLVGIVVDNRFAVIVDADKGLLVQEVIRHFTEIRWAEEAQAAATVGNDYDTEKVVTNMLSRLSIDFKIATPISFCAVAETYPAEMEMEQPTASEGTQAEQQETAVQ